MKWTAGRLSHDGCRSKQEAGRAEIRQHAVDGFKAFERCDWRDVAKCSFCGANGHEAQKLIQGGGRRPTVRMMICDSCIDVCAEMVAEHRTGR